MKRSRRDVIAGVTFIALGLGFAAGATAYPLGTAARMGPGFFPLIVGILVAVFGAVVAFRPDPETTGSTEAPPWRGLVLLLGALVLFGLTVRGLGLVPALLASTFLAALASRQTSPVVALGMAVGLTGLSVLIFVIGLRLNLPLLGTWLPRF